ncbi:MAG: alpha-ketoglutarate-dependent dioxygenase AlkB [bacterium]|nr:alpha-ketoglutarate-dependent dioxygenase AlkB [bacterium]
MVLPPELTYRPGVFDAAASAAHIAGLIAELAWEAQRFTIYGRTMPMPRLIAMYGPAGYRYSGVVHPPQPLAPRLETIRTVVEQATGLRFNAVLANLYRDGRDSVGWHRDDDYVHGGQAAIASVSFGAVRRFELREAAGAPAIAVDLEPGSLLLMHAGAVQRFAHRVPKTTAVVGPRVNLTFRHMLPRGTGPSPAPRRRA